jgi:hypothetical protein
MAVCSAKIYWEFHGFETEIAVCPPINVPNYLRINSELEHARGPNW